MGRVPHPFVFYIVWCIGPNRRVRTYEGITNDLANRLRKHRGEIKGGAKFTSRYALAGYKWVLGATAHGFRSHQEVLQFEFAIHKPHISKHLKHRKARYSDFFTRNVSNMFSLSEQEKYCHVRGVVHSMPEISQPSLAMRHTVVPASFLDDGDYAKFAETHGLADLGKKPAPQVAGKRQRATRKESIIERYQEQARRLLESARQRAASAPESGNSRTR